MSRAVSPLTSVVLDFTRFCLAMAVACGHWTQQYFQEGWPDLTRLAVQAVGGFFVLSGFTIRLLTPAGKEFSPGSFFVERLSRLWSVALPAVGLTCVLDSAAYLIDRGYYLSGWGGGASHPIFRIVINLLFMSEFWGRDVELFSNSLFWSLSYEAGFYFLYWIYRSTSGNKRYVLTLLGCLLIGPNIVVLLVPWLAGVMFHDLFARIPLLPPRATIRKLLATVGALGVLVTALASAYLFTHGGAGLADALTEIVSREFARADAVFGRTLVGIQLRPGKIYGDVIVGAVEFWVFFSFAALLIKGLEGTHTIPSRLVGLGRRLGDFTFPLYLFHFPMFVLVGALGFYERRASFQKAAIFLGICAAIFVLSPLTTKLK
jgi:peptidoglycan/LPS O-acetylase OafA/YrhL